MRNSHLVEAACLIQRCKISDLSCSGGPLIWNKTFQRLSAILASVISSAVALTLDWTAHLWMAHRSVSFYIHRKIELGVYAYFEKREYLKENELCC